MELIVGSYEQLILGYRLITNEDGLSFETSFTDHSHTGCVRTVAVSQRGILASGSSDETIQLFNLKKRKEIGALVHHEGSVMGVCFHKGTHLFSASEDGTVAVWQVGKWECLRTLRGHKGPVYALCVHPSGKLALSAGKDKTLRTWNLMTAKAAYVTNIKQIVDLIQWSPDGDMYILVSGTTMDVYVVESGSICYTVSTDFRIHCALFMKENVVVLGGAGGNVHIYDVAEEKMLYKFSTGTIRIKGMAWCPEGKAVRLATASSDGKLQLWRLSAAETWTTELLAEVDTKFRLTCLAMFCTGSLEACHRSGVKATEGSHSIKDDKTIDTEEAQTCERQKEKGKVTVTTETDSEDEMESHRAEKRTSQQRYREQRKKKRKRTISTEKEVVETKKEASQIRSRDRSNSRQRGRPKTRNMTAKESRRRKIHDR